MSQSNLVISRRFGVQQETQVRAIDVLSACNINASTGSREKVQVQSADAAATVIREWMRNFAGSGRALLGKSFDLKSAHRQLGICAETLACSLRACQLYDSEIHLQ